MHLRKYKKTLVKYVTVEWQGCAQNNNYFEKELSDFVVILVYTHYKQFEISLVLHDIYISSEQYIILRPHK